jgi:hypothetical protein
MRKFIRHPARIPLSVFLDTGGVAKHQPPREDAVTRDVSLGGLQFENPIPIPCGTLIRLRFSIRDPFEAPGVVVWCREESGHYVIGVHFDDDYTKYAVRMVEQICWIEDYRQRVLEEEGRKLSPNEAACEWISRFAERFARQSSGLH